MNIEEMRKRKKELGYTNAMIAEKTGLSIGAVQKFFSGETTSPRYDTILKLEKLLKPNAGEARELAFKFYTDTEKKSTETGAQQIEIFSKRMLTEECSPERWPGQGRYTLNDYYALPDEIRVELIDGVIYDMTSPTKKHQTIALELGYQFKRCIDEHDMPCMVYAAPVDVRLDMDDKTMVQPDVVVICHEDDNDAMIEGAPEFVAEILSPSTRRKDCIVKLNKYLEAGVNEYWIVDPDEEKITVYDFSGGKFPQHYMFSDSIPVGISGGLCKIDFARIKAELERSERIWKGIYCY